MATKERNTEESLSAILELEAATLAGVSEILHAVGWESELANSLGACRELIDRANERISYVASKIPAEADNG